MKRRWLLAALSVVVVIAAVLVWLLFFRPSKHVVHRRGGGRHGVRPDRSGRRFRHRVQGEGSQRHRRVAAA